MRQAARTDTNHAEIREGLRALGWHVVDTHQLGHGFPTMAVIGRCSMALLTVKRSGEELTRDERIFSNRCTGALVYVVHSLEEATTAIENSL